MKTVSDYIGLPYLAHGRTPSGFDCWGLVRDAHVNIFGRSELPSFNEIPPTHKRSLTRATEQLVLSERIREVSQPEGGALATAWYGGVCIHIGIVVTVDERLWVLETEDATGGRLTQLDAFGAAFQKVVYYVGD